MVSPTPVPGGGFASPAQLVNASQIFLGGRLLPCEPRHARGRRVGGTRRAQRRVGDVSHGGIVVAMARAARAGRAAGGGAARRDAVCAKLQGDDRGGELEVVLGGDLASLGRGSLGAPRRPLPRLDAGTCRGALASSLPPPCCIDLLFICKKLHVRSK